MKVMVVFGTRPEAIKMAPLVKALQQAAPALQTVVCVTAQHREMLDQVLRLFDLQPEYDLNVMKPGQDLFDITTQILTGLKPVLAAEQPDLVLVSGRDWQQYQDPETVLSQVPALSATPAGKNRAIHAIDGHALQGGLSLTSLQQASQIAKWIKLGS